MPNFDKTGPQGKGPKTGRGIGECIGSFAGSSFGRGACLRRQKCGRGQGFGRGVNSFNN